MVRVDNMHGSHAQFTTIPPLEMVQQFFKNVTGIPFKLDAMWTSWLAVEPDDVFEFISYVRPCHHKLLMETADRVQPNPCSFLRQLLRPHGFAIRLSKKRYIVEELKEESKTVGKKAGATVVWTS